MIVKALISVIITVMSLAITFLTIFQLTLFISNFSNTANFGNLTSAVGGDSSGDVVESAKWSSIVDISLLIIFIVQHSFTTSPLLKFVSFLNAEYMHHILFNLLTSAILQAMMVMWHPIPEYVLWVIKVDESHVLNWLFVVLHVCSWLLLYIMAISADIAGILGIKWVYYEVTGRGYQRNDNRCLHFNKLKGSYQHPGLVCLTVVLWAYPVMRLDRLFLAVIWTVYMALAWDVDENNVNYVLEQRRKKFVS